MFVNNSQYFEITAKNDGKLFKYIIIYVSIDAQQICGR